MKNLFTERAVFRKLGVALVGGVALLAMQGTAVAAPGSIKDTKHNLSTTNAADGANKFAGANGSGSEICAFCHTPHGADTAAPAPLWNRKLGAQGGAEFKTYAALGTSTLDGATAPVGSVSLACLSCHDGTQAMNTAINLPGSGQYNKNGHDMAGTWSGDRVEANGRLSFNTKDDKTGTAAKPANIAYIGVDLQNDHPVGIQYAGGGYLSSANAGKKNEEATGTGKDSDFKKPMVNSNGTTATFWVETSDKVGRDKTDMILYTRSDNSVEGGAAQPFVECASCHDPHVGSQSAGEVNFLRITNVGSKLCLACHTK